MEKKFYMGKLFSNRREKLVEMCAGLQDMGKSFLYIMPSSAAIFQVRDSFARLRSGILGSRVIVFDDLEMDIVGDSINPEQVIYEPIDRVIISNVCRELKDSLRVYGSIYNKRGFHQELLDLIRSLKRSCMDEKGFLSLQEKIEDEVLKDKLQDLALIYRGYNNSLRSRGIYDRNDVSLRAIELAKAYRGFKDIEAIIIDGFTDIEAVSLGLVREIASQSSLNIYVNCPYENSLTGDFLREEILEPFRSFGFEIIEDDNEEYGAHEGIKSLSRKFYSGERALEEDVPLTLVKYQSIEGEVRETARSIKGRLMKGEEPENIAVYINNKEAYSEYMVSIFREFEIPLSMTFELPLGSSELVRKILKDFKNREEETLLAGEWIEALEEELDGKKEYMEVLVKKALEGELDQIDSLELKAIDALEKLKGTTKLSFEKSGIIGDMLSGEYFMEYMLEGMTVTKVALEQGNNRGVKVMDTSLAKGVYFNHVYILGLNEGEVPGTVKSTGIFDSFEIEGLKEIGIRYRDFMWELTRDKIRFNLSLSSAWKSLALSYRGSSEDGRFAIPSSFIDEIKFLLDKKEDRSLSMRDRFETDFNKTMTRRELQRGLLKESFEGRYKKQEADGLEELVELVEENNELERIMKRGSIEYHREMEGYFNEYEGIIGSDFQKISELIGKFSPSALGEYIKCPFKYMITNLIKPGEEEKDDGMFTPLEIGDLYHRVLFGYYSNVRQFECFEEELFRSVFEEAFSGMRELEMAPGDRERLGGEYSRRLQDFITLDIERFVKFKKETGGRELRPYILEGLMDATELFGINMYCKIDRVDLEFEVKNGTYLPTGRYVVYDYKKNSMKELDDVLQNEDYQLPIYFHVVEKRIKDTLKLDNLECMALLYLSIEATEKANKKRKGKKLELDGIYKAEYKKLLSVDKKGDIAGEAFLPLMEYVKGQILSTIASIKSGEFNYKPLCEVHEGSSAVPCEYQGICRYSKNKVRTLGEVRL